MATNLLNVYQRSAIISILFSVALCIILTACSPAEHHTQGYIEGRYTYITTPVAGKVMQFFADKGDSVKKGQTLFTLETQPESDVYQAHLATLNQAIAAHKAIAANFVYAKETYQRFKTLTTKRVLQQAELDRVRANYVATQAQLIEAEANIAKTKATIAEAKWRVTQKAAPAPQDAIVFDRYYQIGEYVDAGKAIFSLLPATEIKAIFYVAEPLLGKIHLQDKVIINCDGCQQSYPAYINFISPAAEYTPPVIYSNENNHKLVYRIEAAFSNQTGLALHPGQPVNIHINFAASRAHESEK